MNHQTIEEQNIAELYATGRLGEADEAAFEEHLLECRECRERVAWAEDLRNGVRRLAADDAASAAAGAPRAEVPSLRRLRRPRRLRWLRPLLAAAVLLALALPLAWLLRERARLLADLGAARRQGVPANPAARGTAAGTASDTALRQALRNEQEARQGLAARVDQLTRPAANVAIFTLGLARGDGGAEAQANRVEVGAAPAWIVLAVELPPGDVRSYRAALVGAGGATVWRGAGLRRSTADTVTLGLWSSSLAPGVYRLRLTAEAPAGAAEPSFEVSFRVERRG